MSKMLAKNPNHRWKATDLLKHKFFVQSEDQIENEIDYPKLVNMDM